MLHLPLPNHVHDLFTLKLFVDGCCLHVHLAHQVMGLTVVNVGGLDIIDGNRKMTLAIMWQLMRRHTLNLLQVGFWFVGLLLDAAVCASAAAAAAECCGGFCRRTVAFLALRFKLS